MLLETGESSEKEYFIWCLARILWCIRKCNFGNCDIIIVHSDCTGLLLSCALYFNNLIPTVSYKSFVSIFVIFSCVVANVGLEQLIGLSVPVLRFIYPIIIVIIVLTFLDKLFNGHKFVYRGSVLFTMAVSLNHGLVAINKNWDFNFPFINLPFNEMGLGWVLPALLGEACGWLLSLLKK